MGLNWLCFVGAWIDRQVANDARKRKFGGPGSVVVGPLWVGAGRVIGTWSPLWCEDVGSAVVRFRG